MMVFSHRMNYFIINRSFAVLEMIIMEGYLPSKNINPARNITSISISIIN